MQVEANGIEFNVKIDGHRGAPWLVLSNSLATNLTMWDRQVEAMRDRFRILGDIKTFTAQGRMTGMILLALPVGITVFTVVMTPDYFRPMLASDGGRMALIIAGGMQLLGALVIRKIVNIKV